MITEQQYIDALRLMGECKKIIFDYTQQQEILRRSKLTDLEREQEDCDHHCIPSGGKWSSATQVTCCLCGKVFP